MIRCQKENFTPYCRKISYMKKTSIKHGLAAYIPSSHRYEQFLQLIFVSLLIWQGQQSHWLWGARRPVTREQGLNSDFIFTQIRQKGVPNFAEVLFCKNLNVLSKYNLISCIVIGTFGTPSLFKPEVFLVHRVGSKNCLSLLPLSTKQFQVCW